jgi:hypothetical protein
MRLVVLALIALLGCNRETQLGTVTPPDAWTRVEDADRDPALAKLYLDYRERKTLSIFIYEGPTGERLRVISWRSEFPTTSLLARLTGFRGRGAHRLDTMGDLAIDELVLDDSYHVGLQIQPEASDDPDKVTRTSTLLASCIGAASATDVKSPCRRAIARTIAAAKDDADGSWMYWYIAGLVFAALVIGRRLQIGRRLLPPKGPSGLPTARVRS